MGQKINPIGLRLGINRTWDSRWFAGKNEYGKLLHEDVKIREILHKELKQAAVARIVIERPHKKCRVTIHSARPGVVIGKKGADIDKLRKRVADITASDVVINIVEIRKPELDATLVAESIAQQLERRVAFRRAMKRAVQSAMRLGAEGIRINCSGRLGGAEIARMGWEGVSHDATKENEVPEGAQGPDPRRCDFGRDVVVRSVRPEGDGARAHHRTPDRGRAACADPSHEARRPCLDPDFPARPGV